MKLKTQNLKELYGKGLLPLGHGKSELLKNEEYDLSLEKAWQYAVINLVGWFEEAEDLAKKILWQASYGGGFSTRMSIHL
jgi:hypothetical protein